MLRDAALLQLELNQRALRAELALKDATPYNVQWRGSRPVFIDVGSFERLRPGEPWVGYRQFCMQFLYPLMLQAYKDLPFHAALRGSLDGISPHDARAQLAGERFRKGVMSNVLLHARLEERHADETGRQVKRDMKRAGFNEELLAANFSKLEKLVRRLEWKAGETAWTGYGEDNTYDDASAAAKADFVREAATRRRHGLVWDVGCNDGRYSRIAAESADLVVAFDADHATVDALYRCLRDEGREDILPLVMSVTDPSPDLGWRGRERALAGASRHAGADALPRRRAPRLHHRQRARARVPRLAARARHRARDRVPRPQRPDGAAAARAASATGAIPTTTRPTFERALEDRFTVERRAAISETRTIFEARP